MPFLGRTPDIGAITDNIVTSAKIADDAVNSDEIAAGAIDLAHMSANSIDSDQYVDGSIDGVHIANDAVVAAAIADNAVDIARLNVSDGSSGQVLTTNGSGTLSFATVGGAYSDWSILTSATNPLVIKGQYISNSASALTHTLPAASVSGGNAGNTIIICNAGAGLVTIARNSSNINSAGADGTLPQGNSVQLVYVDDTIGWFEV